ncbi:MAG: TraB/GumN family protein [Helicobacteraceae bacterium]|nr:TraB/GumN family protein [Helicobacteraceae bacterium]
MRLAKFLSFFVAALFLLAPSAIAKTATDTTARYPFYLAEKDDVKIYALGAMHLGKRDAKLTGAIIDALGRSSKLILEINDSDLVDSSDMIEKYLCPDSCLREQLSAQTYKKMAQDYPELSFFIGRFPAWLAATLLSSKDYMREGYDPKYGAEFLLQRARGKTPIIGLETSEEQFNAMASISLKAQVKTLEDYINMSATKRAEIINDLYKTYMLGDADALFEWYMTYDAKTQSSAEYEEFNKALIFDRNKRMTERLLTHIDSKKPIFVAIGALHLGGDKGVLELLRKKGYKITRL